MVRHSILTAAAASFALAAAASQANAQFDFKGKTIDVIIGVAPGGGTDGSGRLVAGFLDKYLPGAPAIVVRNMPGAQGISAINHVHLQTKRDGLTLMTGGNTQVNPLTVRKANGVYDPAKFHHVGGLGRGGSAVIINKDAENRLYDKTLPPVTFGVIVPTRSSAQVGMWGVEYLGWNMKWVAGYRGANDTALALQRGEVDMITTGSLFVIKQLEESGKFRMINQSGSLENGKYVARPEFAGAPVFRLQVFDKLKDDAAKKAFAYWESSEAIDKWFALAEGSPQGAVEAYRAAFEKMSKDPEFIERGKKISEDLSPMGWRDMETLMKQMASVTQDTDDYISNLLRKQGVKVEGGK